MLKLAADIYDVYMMPNEGLVIVGAPLMDEDKVHDCDAAGCSSLTHVIYRCGKPQVELIQEAAHE